MNKKAYRTALGYAFKLSGKDYRDIVHDSYLAWFKKTGKNLFDEHRGVISQVVKNTYLSQNFTMNQYQWRGEKYPKVYVGVNGHSETLQNIELGYPCAVLKTETTPIDNLVYKELNETIENRLTEEQLRLLNMMKDGLSKEEMYTKEGTYRQLLDHKLNKVKKIVRLTIQ